MEPLSDPLPDPLPAQLSAEFPEPAPVAPPAPTPSLMRRIFVGPFGLRAGWSLAIYIAIIAAIVTGVNLAQKMHKKHTPAAATSSSAPKTVSAPKPAAGAPSPLTPMIIAESIAFAVFFLLSWLMATIERRRVSAYGLGGGKQFFSRFLAGSWWGLVAMALLVGILRALHVLSFDTRLQHGLPVFGWGAASLLAFLLVGLLEEYMFRGFLQFTLTRGMVSIGNLISPKHARSIGFWIAAVITSGLFLYAHTSNSGENKMGLISVFLAGVLFLVALWRTGTLWWAIGFHMAWDWSQSFLYGVPDSGGLMQGRLFATHPMGNPLLSGGTVGPEGSVLLIPVLVLAIVVLVFFTTPSPQPPLELPPSKKLQLAAYDAQPTSETQSLIA